MTQVNLKSNPNSSVLKETRLTKGLTLEIVHEATKIPMDALRAIEEGYSTRILTPFYYRGFIKIYAEFLGLNVVDVLKEYNVSPTTAKVALKQTSSKPLLAATKGPNALMEQWQDFGRRFWTAKNRGNLLRIVGAIVAIFILVKMVGCVVGIIKSQPKNPKMVVIMKPTKKQYPVKKEQAKEEAQRNEPSSAIQEASGTVAVESQNNKVTLAIHSPKDTWIQVKADGKIVFQMTMKKGTVENWEAKDSIELSGKNIGDLDLEVNGKDISLSSSPMSHRAKKILITKSGLTVKK